MPQPHRSLTALPGVAATAAAVALVSSCSTSAPTPAQQPSITFSPQGSTEWWRRRAGRVRAQHQIAVLARGP